METLGNASTIDRNTQLKGGGVEIKAHVTNF